MSKRTKTSNDSDKLLLAQAIHGVSKTRDAFVKAVDNFNAMEGEVLTNLGMRIDAKRAELEEAIADCDQQKRRAQIDFENFMQEHRREGAVKTLQETNEVPIDADTLSSLRSRLEELENSLDEKIADARRHEREQFQREKAGALHTKDLEHAAETAKLTAALDQKASQIEVLHETIANLKTEVSNQRDLTREVTANFAKASASSHPMYMPSK